jgi:hypothetical protein
MQSQVESQWNHNGIPREVHSKGCCLWRRSRTDRHTKTEQTGGQRGPNASLPLRILGFPHSCSFCTLLWPSSSSLRNIAQHLTPPDSAFLPYISWGWRTAFPTQCTFFPGSISSNHWPCSLWLWCNKSLTYPQEEGLLQAASSLRQWGENRTGFQCQGHDQTAQTDTSQRRPTGIYHQCGGLQSQNRHQAALPGRSTQGKACYGWKHSLPIISL